MIPELKNRIQVLEGELLRLEECVEEVHHRQQLIQFWVYYIPSLFELVDEGLDGGFWGVDAAR